MFIKAVLIGCLTCGTLLAQAAKPAEKPTIPAAEASAYQALVIQAVTTQSRIAQDQKALADLSAKGVALAKTILTELKLDPAKNDVRVLDDGTVGIVEKTESKK